MSWPSSVPPRPPLSASFNSSRSAAEAQIIGMKTFGASAPLKESQRKVGFEPERVVAAAKEVLGRG
jgi:transketolase